MKEQRVRFMSNASTLASFSEPGSCYDELLKYLVHVVRKGSRQLAQLSRAAARRAGLQVCSSPAPEPPQHRRRRRTRQPGSIHHLVHHHHHHHHHYHLGNGSLRADRASLEPRDVESGSVTNGGRRLASLAPLPLPPSSTLPTSTTTAPPMASSSGSVHSIYHADCHLEPVLCSSSSAPAANPSLQGFKRNSVPGALPVAPKNYPTLHPSSPQDHLREMMPIDPMTSSCGTFTVTNLNIPPPSVNSTQCLIEAHSPIGKYPKLQKQIINRDGTNKTSKPMVVGISVNHIHFNSIYFYIIPKWLAQST